MIQNYLKHYDVKAIYATLVVMIPNFSAFCSMARRRLVGHFEANALNNPQMTQNVITSKVPPTCSTSMLESQISNHFALQRFFEKKRKKMFWIYDEKLSFQTIWH